VSLRAKLAAPGRRTAVIGFLAVLVVGSIGLAIAGASDKRTTAFSVDVPPVGRVVTLAPGQLVCQGPIPVAAPARGLTASAPRGATSAEALQVTVKRSDSGVELTQGRLTPTTDPSGRPALSGSFARTIASGQRISVCLRSVGHRVGLSGSTSWNGSGVLTVGGKPTNLALALVFAAPHPASVISLIPTIFRRAALFHPAWMGAWVFWVLVAGMLAGALLMLATLVNAVAIDERGRRELDRPPPPGA
jgi:hypothetical protein